MLPAAPDTPLVTVPFVTITTWVRAARLCGIDIEEVFREVGLDTATLDPEHTTIARDRLQQLMLRCTALSHAARGPHFPLVLGESFAFEYLSDVETYITTSATLRDAARAFDWISPLVTPLTDFSLAEHGQQARLSVHYRVDDADHLRTWPFSEAVIASIIKFCRMLLAGSPLEGRITLRHPAHERSDAVAQHYQLPVAWGADVDALWFDRALLDLPLGGALPVLHQLAAERVARKVASQTHAARPAAPHLLIKQIERAYLDKPRLLGMGLEATATELQFNARTLQRRLKELGESHSAIQARVRYQLAQTWLRQGLLSIEDISDRLGFSDRRSFTQAFTRWSGLTPSQYRRQGG